MFYHDDEKGHIIIGEAAISLSLRGHDITTESLLQELAVMADGEVSDSKLAEIFDAKRWLQGYSRYGSREQAELHCMMTGQENDG
ncbi:hypothetical protein [Pantoea sp. PNA 03-3]|uniref:hypothetical protein n=1 Tax=Pantoea sp. PNA 03-3 TaxID=2135460 RepID=UPI000D75EC4A|nr:hypothetical protein [Pantoea sp. PNA 03-3]PXV76820.1 hypothetical protein C7433_102513 [Pantoea sp. PNA 03-3]